MLREDRFGFAVLEHGYLLCTIGAAGSDSDTASSLCTKGLRRAVFFVLWANWCAGSPPQVLSGASEDRSTLLARWLCSAVSVREREKAKGARIYGQMLLGALGLLVSHRR